MRQTLFDFLNDVQRRRSAVLHDAQQCAANAVLADDVGLRSKAIAHMSDVAHVDGRAVLCPNGKIVQLGDCLRAAIHPHIHFQCTDLGSARRKNEILRVNSIYYIHRSETVGLQGLGIEIHCDHSRLTPIRKRNRSALHRCERSAHKVQSQVIQFLFWDCLATQANLNNGYARCRIHNHQRRLSSRR